MKYERIYEGTFLERPNRFIAYIDIDGKKETVHVKNTGRCAELLIPGTKVYVQKAENPERKTKWDLIAVLKKDRLINMDSQVPNAAAKEWIEGGGLFREPALIRREYTYGKSRIDLYVEAENKKILIEVKGVTLEEDGVVCFPDAPSDRAVKHVEELAGAVKEGYECYVLFVVQMEGVKFFTPNRDTHPAFCEALKEAEKAGVKVMAVDCHVEKDKIEVKGQVPVILEDPRLYEMRDSLISWYRENRRKLPWREDPTPYHVWISEIMLQQTRVEAVKPYYARFLKALPTVKDLAEAGEDTLLKLWEGLGYYNRVRNMQKAAQQIMMDFDGQFPDHYEAILSLKGIGSYTAGAISAFAYGLPKAAVDGNVLRVLSRILGSREDIMKASVKKQMEEKLEKVIPPKEASDFGQGLIELGALICLPNGEPKCRECPLQKWCSAYREGLQDEIPVRRKPKERKKEKKTVFIFRDGEKAAIRKRPKKGLLAGLYELPNEKGHLSMEEAVAYSKKIGLTPVRVKALGEAKHIFSHVEWEMTGYFIWVDELEKSCREPMLFVRPEEVEKEYPIPSAFEKYVGYLNIRLGNDRYSEE